jgi:hypothetical protein
LNFSEKHVPMSFKSISIRNITENNDKEVYVKRRRRV